MTEQLQSPSLVQLAADAIRRMILAGELAEGERLIEERLTEQLGISRPPLREALRVLEQEGLIVTRPRRGSTVATLTDQDVFEILTLRSALERLAVELGVPVRSPARLEAARDALLEMERCATAEDRGSLVQAGYRFHSSLVALAGHRRLDEAYASVQQQLLLCMARNLYAREHFYEDLSEHVARHRKLLDLVEAGDPAAVLAELAVHGERSFSEIQSNVGNRSASSS
ncbi:transcriptional regulator, GntR family [Kribbella flavida DSM 17836]|uniref:Transcriptional regulator, GntR family n=1 Tax=Kribbella flavida (strain DSM 17836 / JCM 10339 / NBRC 14399) TaxID=479435 RepID=D2PMU8_KRIFD|nr:GntR family transcriptional regulator [Kribbella flavida]ADB32650.1 transcriptional regulator, GntR family [Kribbella flavida DSM 17836]